MECRKKRTYTETEQRTLRRTTAWKKKSKRIKEEARYLCQVCEDMDVYTYDHLEVHHIRKLSDYPEGLLDDENLVCLCTRHHKMADAGEISMIYLQELARKRGQR